MEDRALPSAVWLELIQNANERTGDDAVIRVWRDGDTSAALTAEVQMSGTATYDTDYSGFNGTSVSIGAGSDHADLHFTPIQNNTPDALTIVANLQPGMGYDMGSPAIATAAIFDSTAATFVLGSDGNLRYDVPWGSVDPAQASQSLALSNFAITVSDGMSTYTLTPSNASFTTSPTAQFAYGVMTGITFAIDTSSIGGFAYSSLSASGSTLSAVLVSDSSTVTAAMADVGAGGFDLGTCHEQNGLGLAAGSITVTLTWGDNSTTTVTVNFDRGIDRSQLARAITQELARKFVAVTNTGAQVDFCGSRDYPLKSFSVSITNNSAPVGYSTPGVTKTLTGGF